MHFFLLIISLFHFVFSQNDNNWLCESLICDPPKKCILVDQVAQCLIESSSTPPFLGTINGGQPLFPTSGQESSTFSTTKPVFTTQQPLTSSTPTTPPSPFAPFLNFFNGVTPSAGLGGNNVPPPPTLIPSFTFPTLPTIPTTPPSTSLPSVDICSLPPITGTCSRARIMWYYDTESRRCERFSWSGCGNQNRFSSKAQCEQTCSQNSSFRRNVLSI